MSRTRRRKAGAHWPSGLGLSRHAMAVAAVACGVVVLLVILWTLHYLVLLIFGAVLLTVVLLSLSRLIERTTGAGHHLSLFSAISLIALSIALFVYLLGSRLQQDISDLADRLPDLAQAMESTFGFNDFAAWAEARMHALIGDASVLSGLANLSATFATGAVDVILVLAGAIYFAIEPERYRAGCVKLIPPGPARETADDTMGAIGGALRLWLLGQLASMIFVWILTTLGLFLIGLPNAFALGLIAGILEFIPFVGPIAAAVPALATALSIDPPIVWSTLAVYVGIHLAEMALLVPLIQRRAVDLPPAITLFAVLAFGILFGPLGIFFAAPLAVATFVLVRKLWVRELLGEQVTLPGEEAELPAGKRPARVAGS